MNERSGNMVLLACHGVYDSHSKSFYGEHPEDRPVYDAQISYAFNHLQWRSYTKPLLVISGGETKRQRKCSESRSYIELAHDLGLSVPKGVVLEEYAMTSIDNLLLGLYAYHISTGNYPEVIDVISWEFKRKRFEKTLEAINKWDPLGESWEGLNFFPVGDLWSKPKTNVLPAEEAYIESLRKGINEYYSDAETMEVISGRDVYKSRSIAKRVYADYPLPF